MIFKKIIEEIRKSKQIQNKMDCKIWLFHYRNCPYALEVERRENPCISCDYFYPYSINYSYFKIRKGEIKWQKHSK